MQFLYQLRPTRLGMLTDGPTVDETPVLAAHLKYVQDLAAAGTVLMAGRTQNNDETTFGICVFEAENQAAAEALVAADPAIQAGLMRAELFPYWVAAWSAKGPRED